MQRIIPGLYPKFPGAAGKGRMAGISVAFLWHFCGKCSPQEPNSTGTSLYGAEVAPGDGRAGNVPVPVGIEGLPTAGTPRTPPGSPGQS